MFCRYAFFVAPLVVLSGELRAAGTDCDPLSFKDKTVAFRDTQTQVQYAQDITDNRAGDSESSGGLDFFDIVKLNGEARSHYVANLRKITNIDFKQSDRQYLYISAMTNNELQGYLPCLQRSDTNIFIVPSSNSAGSAQFDVKVNFRGSLGATSFPVVINLSGGTITSPPSGTWKVNKERTQAGGRMRIGAGVSGIGIGVKRQAGQPFEMRVSAGSPPQTELMSFPAPPTLKLVEEIRYSDPIESKCADCNNESVQSAVLQINLPDNEVINRDRSMLRLWVGLVAELFTACRTCL
jgi:hypothetical protein